MSVKVVKLRISLYIGMGKKLSVKRVWRKGSIMFYNVNQVLCPYCEGQNEDCDYCGGDGYIYEEIKKEGG